MRRLCWCKNRRRQISCISHVQEAITSYRSSRTKASAARIVCGQAKALLGGEWNHLPLEFGNNSSGYRAFCRWEKKAVFDILWAILLTKCDELQGVDWQWQSANGCLGKARGVPKSGVGKRGHKSSASARATAPSLASRKACWSRATAGPLQPASAEPTRPTPVC